VPAITTLTYSFTFTSLSLSLSLSLSGSLSLYLSIYLYLSLSLVHVSTEDQFQHVATSIRGRSKFEDVKKVQFVISINMCLHSFVNYHIFSFITINNNVLIQLKRCSFSFRLLDINTHIHTHTHSNLCSDYNNINIQLYTTISRYFAKLKRKRSVYVCVYADVFVCVCICATFISILRHSVYPAGITFSRWFRSLLCALQIY